MSRTTLPESFIRKFTKDWNKYRKMVIKNTTKKQRENMYLVPVASEYNKEQHMELLDLMKQIGVKADYYNSDEVGSRLSYLYAKKIAFVNTNFYYRQDNPDAITKTLKWFMVDLLTTNILLFTRLEENLGDKTILEDHLSRLNKEYFYWYRFYLKCKFNLIKNRIDKDKKQYMKVVLRSNRKKLIMLNKKYSAKNKIRLIVI